MSEPSSYRLARAHSVAVLGRFVAGTGVLVAAIAVISAVVDDLPDPIGGALLVALLAGVLLAATAAVRVLRPPAVLHLDDAGYRVRVLRGAGPGSADWTDVTHVRRERLAPGVCLVISLTGGARTVVPLSLLQDAPAVADRLDADLRARLDRAHGQRRLG